jgi:hypothetical protein
MLWTGWSVAALMAALVGTVRSSAEIQGPPPQVALDESALAKRARGKLKFLYRIRMTYPQGWSVNVVGDKGTEAYHFYLAEGTVEGRINGKLKGANQPRTRPDGTFLPDLKGAIETSDGATIIFNIGGYGRAYPVGRRQIVATVLHVAEDKRYSWLNDTIAVGIGEVRARPQESESVAGGKMTIRGSVELVLDVSEVVWEPIPD